MNDPPQPSQLQTVQDGEYTAAQDVKGWPPINVLTTCDHYLSSLASLQSISSLLGPISGSVNVEQKTRYMERRSLLQHWRDKCDAHVRAINYKTTVPNVLSISCQNVLYIIDGQLLELEVWLQAASESDRRDLESITRPEQQPQVEVRRTHLPLEQQQALRPR